MSMKKTRNSKSLPDDLITEILSRLPVKTLLRFKSASKSFLNLIISSEFVKLHLCRSLIRNSSTILLRSSDEPFLASFDLDHLQCPPVRLDTHPDVIKYNHLPRIMGRCNGVVCFKNDKDYVLYNPATRAYKKVPIRVIRRRRLSNITLYHEEFAYDCISDDFKILCFVKYFDETEQQTDSKTYLYNLKDNSWSKIKNPPRGFHSIPSSCCNSNDSLYWLTYDRRFVNLRVVRFDVSSHSYEEISIPIQVPGLWNISLRVLNGRLHIMDQEFGLNIWMLKEDNCWSRVFHSSDSEFKHFLSSHSMTGSSLEPFAYSKDGRKIIIEHLRKYKKVICCDLESQTLSVVQLLGLPEGGTFTVIPSPWTESLLPLA